MTCLNCNVTDILASNTTLQFFTGVNTLVDAWPSRLFLIGMYVLIWFGVFMRTGEALNGMIAAGFVTSMLSIMFYGLGLVSQKEPMWALIALLASVLVVWIGGLRREG